MSTTPHSPAQQIADAKLKAAQDIQKALLNLVHVTGCANFEVDIKTLTQHETTTGKQVVANVVVRIGVVY